MKITIYLSFIFLLSFTVANAQKDVDNNQVNSIVKNLNKKQNSEEIIKTFEIDKSFVKTRSEIRLFFNIERKENNIKFIFPDINKRKLT